MDKVREIFDRQAASYDATWSKMAPIRDALHLFMNAVLAGLPQDARILCVGIGTGEEIIHLAGKFPGWRFTAVEPSGPMLDVFRRKADERQIAARCEFHEGYLDSLPDSGTHHAATCLLVSQFILDPSARSDFFRGIADRLCPDGILINAELACDTVAYENLLGVWLRAMRGNDVPPEAVEQARQAYGRDVAVLPPETIEKIIEAGGFRSTTRFYQAGLIQAWFSRKG